MTRSRWRAAGLVILFSLLGLWLRLLWLDKSPLRGDEAFAIQYWAAPWPDGLTLTRIEPHPYGTFALFALWRGIFGEGEWVMRLLPALLSLPGIAAIYVAGRHLFRGRRAGLIAALLYAIHPFLIWHAQDARNYAIWAMTSAVVLAAFLRAITVQRRGAWLLYAFSALVSAYIFFFEIFFIAAQGLYLLLFQRRSLRRWLPAVALMG
ncbi:MAG: glycosyltransferase family 39 protein, partial [Anaerolineae bacterium]|nr:glycosyltransferase family 39 protein [Anaerolineae bacterium]